MAYGVRFGGVYPMLYAFFDRRGGLDRAAMKAQVEFCVRNRAHGIACLGLGTEVKKLSPEERRQVVAWAAEDLAGRLPLAVTVFGATPAEQSAFVGTATALGADWVILQPPQTGDAWTEEELVRFFGAVADRSPVPVAIQNAPQYIGVGLTAAGIDTLSRNHPNVSLLKAEGSAVETEALIRLTEGRIDVFQGRGGLEFPDVIRAGCVGMIPSVESIDAQSRLFALLRTEDAADRTEGERLYARLAPLMVFLMQSIDSFLCYGKRLTAQRIGVDQVVDRAPALAPTPFGLACLARHASVLETHQVPPA